jgi:hypothetical protein
MALDGLKMHGILLALVAVIGGFVYSFVGGLLPSFSFSGIVYAIVGLVIVAVGFHLADAAGGKGYAGAFLIGFGLVMASGLVSAVKGLLPAQKAGA